MGSVHYISPEQAKGEYVDKRSDIYSLGIVFYEMLTGKVPYDEDKAINTALKHVNCQLEIPEKYKHILSSSVQNILLKMTQKNPNDRYLDVSQIIADIDKIQNENEEVSYFVENDYHTKIMPAVKQENIQREEQRPKKKKKRGYKKYFILLAIIVVALSSAYLISAGNIWDALAGNNVKIPDIVGKNIKKATKELEEADLKIRIMSEKEDEETESGTILSQNPDAGIKLRKGEEVSVIVSKQPENITDIPDVVGKSLDEAKKLIEDKKLKHNVKYKFSKDVEEGFVMSQSPAKEQKAKFDDVVTIEVSKGEEVKKEKIPNLVGATLDDARKITGNFSIGSISYQEDTSKPDGRVLSQEPQAGSQQVPGTQINIVINKIEPRKEPEQEKPKIEAEIVTKNLEVVLPKGDDLLITIVDKSNGAIAYSNTISVKEGENVSVQLSGRKGESKEFDIFIGGKYFATTGTITF
jgi:probable serine/threonine-protein kinase sps1